VRKEALEWDTRVRVVVGVVINRKLAWVVWMSLGGMLNEETTKGDFIASGWGYSKQDKA
jgi:hypothetical protein